MWIGNILVKTLGKVDVDKKYIDRVKLGFNQVITNGLGYGYMGKYNNSGGKTPDWFSSGFINGGSHKSIFDPVVCEIAYKWFSKENDKIIDPFAGGSVRGLVAGILKRNYTGIDLSEKQIQANKQQYEEISKKYIDIIKPNWINGDSLYCKELANDKYNLLFTCPPYYNLEVYSDKENDLSNKSTYEEFINSYRQIIRNTSDMLEDNSFAVIVVGDIRDKQGFYRDFISDTKKAFIDCSFKLYNEIILIEQFGTAAMRVKNQFYTNRKVVKVHQNILVFYKGNPDIIKEKLGVLNNI